MFKKSNFKALKGENMYIVTIDGPSASGKSTLAQLVADKLGIVHINSGDAYRAIAYFMSNAGIAPTDTTSIEKALNSNKFEIKYENDTQKTYINGEDVTKYLHLNQVNAVVSAYANQSPQVIYKASDMIRDLATSMSVVIEGRNVGSFCFPEAKYKFYLDCDAYVRAKRRCKEMEEKGQDVNFEDIYKQTLQRDELDKTREIAPLVVPKNSVMLDSTNKTPEQVSNTIVSIILDSEKQK